MEKEERDRLSKQLKPYILLGIILFLLWYVFYPRKSGETIVNTNDKIITVNSIEELNDILLNKWNNKKVSEFVAEYGEPESKYGLNEYIWRDLVVIEEPGGAFEYDIWMYYEDDFIGSFRIGDGSKKMN